MAGAQFTDITVRMLSRGIDAYSSRANIPDGFVEDMENFDTNASGLLRKRKGYVSASGWLPIRVTRVEHSGRNIKFQLDSSQSVDLSNTSLGPIITYGRLDSGITTTSTKLTTTNSCAWWGSLSLSNKSTISVGSNTITQTATDHGISAATLFVGMASVDDDVITSNTTLIPDQVTIDTATYQVDVDYTAISAGEAYVYVSDMSAVAGSTYVETITSATTVQVLASTHSLSNFFIQVKCYELVGSDYIEVIPDSISLDPDDGQVDVTFSSAVTGIVILNSTPIANTYTGSTVEGSNSISIPSPGSPWNFVSIYYYNSVSGTYDSVLADSISYDATGDTLDIEYTLATAAEAIEVYWENASVVNNIIQVTDETTSGSESWTDTNPQITIWGIDHANMYTSATNRGGHVNHIDQYRRTGESRVVAGLGGNLFASRTREEVSDTYCLPSYYVHLRERVDGDQDIAPLFQSSAITRTRGAIVDTSVSSGYATITAATYVSATETDYTLSFDSAATITNKVDTNDEFIITGMPYAPLNGTFQFVSVSNDASTAPVIRLKNTSGNARYDCTNVVGSAGCFTDKITITTNSRIGVLAGDTVLGENVTGTITVVTKVYDDIYVRGITSGITWPDNVRISFSSSARTVLPLRDSTGLKTITNYVAGDMVTVTGNDHPVRVVRVGNGTDSFVDAIVGDGTTATVTHSSSPDIEPGDKIIISGSDIPEFNGEVVITAVNSSTEFEYSSTGVGSASYPGPIMITQVIELENSVSVSDYQSGTLVSVDSRWIPIEAPDDSYDLPVKNYRKHFDTNSYDSQPILRSVMVNDTLYAVNGSDEVMKMDGDNIYRAGLFRWQPHVFTQVDTTVGSIVPITTSASVDTSGTNGNVYTMGTAAEASLFGVGDRIQDSKDDAFYTVVEIDSTNGYVEVDRSITGDHATPGTISIVSIYNYYFRLNAIDANGNVVAGAITSSNGDCAVALGSSGQIKHRLIGMPAWDIYDYDRLEVQMYRTKADSVAPFYLIQTVSIPFDNYQGYIDLVDSAPDFTLTSADLDTVNSALLGAELGVGWKEPLRAKHITSTNNRLILGNCTGYPKFDIVLNKKAQEDLIEVADLTGKIFTFRKDSTSTSTTTDMTDVVRYEFIDNSGATTITPNTDISTTTSTFTVTDGSHTLSAGDWVYLYHAAEGAVNDLTFTGWWQVASVVASTSFTINMENHGRSTSGGTTADVDRYVTATAKMDIPVLLGTDGNYNQEYGNITTTYETKSTQRLANAINASMRMVDKGVNTSFVPWLTAGAGNDFTRGQIVISQPKTLTTTAEVLLPTWTSTSPFDVYVHGIKRASAAEVSSSTGYYPSRVLISYPNFPEIFDNPEVVQDIYSSSVVDINAADGQEVTALITFFGESTFGAAQLNDAVLVFKENSIYLLNPETGDYVKIDSRGLGCDAPRSVASTRNGIMFANKGGIYRVNRNMDISYVGKYVQRYWKNTVNKNRIDEITGHQYGIGRTYKLSVPVGEGLYNSKVLVYNHDMEGAGQEFGSWSRYSSHNATGWCNLQDDAFFGTTAGDVFKVRNLGVASDYRDGGSAITSYVTTRGNDFGIPGARKLVGGAFVSLQLDTTDVTNLSVTSAMDLKSSFSASGTITASMVDDPYVTARISLPSRRGTNVSMKLSHSTIDEDVVITGLSYSVARLSGEGIKEAADYS